MGRRAVPRTLPGVGVRGGLERCSGGDGDLGR